MSPVLKEIFQRHNDTQNTNTSKMFQVPIGNSKCVDTFKFHNDARIIKYCQKSFNICCLSSLESSFSITEETKADNDTSLCTEESSKSKFGNRIDFANYILKMKNI